jgi:hypothetical protein
VAAERPPRGVDWEREAKKLLARAWTDLRVLWLDVAPTSPLLGEAPEYELGEIASVVSAVSGVDERTGLRLDVEPDGLREAMLCEAVYLLHKAAHVIGAARIHVERGILTWSLSSAYQAAAFAMRSILMLLGVAVVEVGNRAYMVDVWSPVSPRGTSKKQRQAPPAVEMHKVMRADHKAMWIIFRRMLRVAKVPPDVWPTAIAVELEQLQPGDFARQRNRLHYRNCHWPLDDLHACRHSESFGILKDGFFADEASTFDADADDFSLTLGLTLVFFAIRLTRDLGSTSNVLADEVALVRSWLEQDVLATYATALLA